MKGYYIFLDDIRNPKDCCRYMADVKFYWETKFIVVRNYDAFVKLITDKHRVGEYPICITFDHDLADEHYAPSHVWDQKNKYLEWEAQYEFTEKTGLDCAKWLSDFCIENRLALPEYRVHSKNPYGGANIQSYLDNHKKHVLL